MTKELTTEERVDEESVGSRRTCIVNIQTIANALIFGMVMYLFCRLGVMPFVSNRIKYTYIGGTAALIAFNLLLPVLFPELVAAEVSLFTQSIPSCILCWCVSRHKGMRFLFVFCSIDVAGFMLLLIANALTIIFHFNESMKVILNLLFFLPLVYLSNRYKEQERSILDNDKNNWGILTVFTVALYAFSYFMILYPEPWVRRPEYAPVILGYAIVVLMSYGIIIKLLVSMDKIHGMEQQELKMQLKLETQKREVEETKSRFLVHQIQPHFIYNVLMSIRYFIKKEPQTAYDMIYDFSQYLRSNIESLTEDRYILWSEELEHIEAYVRIERQRYKERLDVIYDLEEEEFCLPPLTVELLVENAIKHGVGQKSEGGTVWIRGSKLADGYRVMVEDDGVGFRKEELDEKKAIGLKYIKDQLDMMAGAQMRLESEPGKGTKVWIDFREISEETSE